MAISIPIPIPIVVSMDMSYRLLTPGLNLPSPCDGLGERVVIRGLKPTATTVVVTTRRLSCSDVRLLCSRAVKCSLHSHSRLLRSRTARGPCGLLRPISICHALRAEAAVEPQPHLLSLPLAPPLPGRSSLHQPGCAKTRASSALTSVRSNGLGMKPMTAGSSNLFFTSAGL